VKSHVVYLVDETLEHPVLQSQSLSVIRRLLDAGLTVDLLISNGVSGAREEEIARRSLGRSPRVALLSKRHRGSSSLAKAQRAMGRGLARRRASIFLRKAFAEGPRIVLHARGSAMHLGAYLRAQFENSRLVADVRGDAAAEARFNLGGEAGEGRAQMIDRLEARALSRADHVLCVSKALLTEIQARFTFAGRATVIPCVADERRFFTNEDRRLEGRASLGLVSEPLIAYAGSIGQWHQFGATLDTFEIVARKSAAARFLVATREAHEASALVALRPGLEGRVLVRNGNADEVARWLNAADVGLLLREAHPLNRVACPTKFAEYALSGPSVVVSAEIGDLAGFVHDLDLGRCVPGAGVAEAAEACLALMATLAGSEDRVGRVQRAAPVLSMAARLQDWTRAYEDAADRPST